MRHLLRGWSGRSRARRRAARRPSHRCHRRCRARGTRRRFPRCRRRSGRIPTSAWSRCPSRCRQQPHSRRRPCCSRWSCSPCRKSRRHHTYHPCLDGKDQCGTGDSGNAQHFGYSNMTKNCGVLEEKWISGQLQRRISAFQRGLNHICVSIQSKVMGLQG